MVDWAAARADLEAKVSDIFDVTECRAIGMKSGLGANHTRVEDSGRSAFDFFGTIDLQPPGDLLRRHEPSDPAAPGKVVVYDAVLSAHVGAWPWMLQRGEALDLTRVAAESVLAAGDLDLFAAPSGVDAETVEAMTVFVAVGLSIAAPRISWPHRPAARKARERVAVSGETAISVASGIGADGADLFAWLTGLVGTSVRLLSDIAANAVPIVRVETGISLPSTVLAYKLYGDVSRAGQLVEVAGSATPMLMPSAFDALES